MNLYGELQAASAGDPTRLLLQTEQGERFSYADAERESARMANYLVALGAEPGDRITAQLDKTPAVLWLYLGCLRAGLVYHPLNTAYQVAELGYFLADAKPRIVVCTSRASSLLEPLAESAGVSHVLTLDPDGSGSLAQGAAGCPGKFATVPRQAGDMAALLYSSGTTGRPKGIMLSHENLAANGRTLAELWGFGPEDTLLHVLPIFHVHGLFIAIHCVLMSGAAMRWLERFDAGAVIRNLPECTVMMGVPTYYTRLLAEPALDSDCCRNMRLFISGSAPLLTETFEAFRHRTGHVILERYGMSETGMNTSNPLHGERRAGTVGPPLPGVQVRVVDDQGRVLPAGEAGRLQVKGPNVFRGYWRQPEKTREDFTPDGFFNTGDMAVMSADDYIAIVGRAKDMIISGGLNVYPKEIEQLLDGMAEIEESAVIGVPHPDFGEAVVAAVVARPGHALQEGTVISFAREQVANFKVPKRVFVVAELPRNAMGKVQKNLLRERYRDCCREGDASSPG